MLIIEWAKRILVYFSKQAEFTSRVDTIEVKEVESGLWFKCIGVRVGDNLYWLRLHSLFYRTIRQASWLFVRLLFRSPGVDDRMMRLYNVGSRNALPRVRFDRPSSVSGRLIRWITIH